MRKNNNVEKLETYRQLVFSFLSKSVSLNVSIALNPLVWVILLSIAKKFPKCHTKKLRTNRQWKISLAVSLWNTLYIHVHHRSMFICEDLSLAIFTQHYFFQHLKIQQISRSRFFNKKLSNSEFNVYVYCFVLHAKYFNNNWLTNWNMIFKNCFQC